MPKARKFVVVAALVSAFTLVGATAASATAQQFGNLRCSGYYPTPTVHSNTTGYVLHDWWDNTTYQSKQYGWPTNGAHSSTGWTVDSNDWTVTANTILSAGGTCA